MKYTRFGLPKVAVEQVKVASLVSLKFQWSRRQDHKPYLTEAIEKRIEDVDLIFMKLHGSRSKPQISYS
ncbi:hypothetical protein F383_25121 [Gossypium arboreum]|uniref:Uncharacterized protein n=1 Tax=Gossypium arboreum TaxID=29729 RepID=A0A0B0P0Z7_GOSAR|nr:hypothetical protein F383_25121 [Gossypium arboreum]